ncbi:hypothetical protein MAPG_05103 [Magnaporthiopsis poae ATCC 64411]|uniref:Uncharacterized protein n=1 Tax=Magnaporthiopsis poae (strain ATCC 64411 / 73-15) TaxID=644358 RepID=A0A0C4DYI1_MAGP6|nr:hypothetical protein MAPG_05103 [Magnaporthiopsis poae ATCC 64411]
MAHQSSPKSTGTRNKHSSFNPFAKLASCFGSRSSSASKTHTNINSRPSSTPYPRPASVAQPPARKSGRPASTSKPTNRLQVGSSSVQASHHQQAQRSESPSKARYSSSGTSESSSRRRSMNEQDRLNRLSQELLTPDILAETLHIFDKAMRHTPYAVSGMSALAAWGYTAKCPRHVSVVVPAYSKDTILSWAKPAGFETFASRPDLLGVPTADGKFRRIRLKYIESCDDDGWGDFRSVRLPIFMPPALANSNRSTEEGDMTETTPVVLQLPTLFNLAACSFVSDAARRSSNMRSNIARDIFWILGRMADRAPGEEGTGPLTPDAAAMLTDKDFWREFTFAFPKAPGLFTRAGMSSSLVEEMTAEAEGRQPRRRPDGRHRQQQEQEELPPPTPPKDAKWQRTPLPTTSQLPPDDSRTSWPHASSKYEPYRPVSGSHTVDGRHRQEKQVRGSVSRPRHPAALRRRRRR